MFKGELFVSAGLFYLVFLIIGVPSIIFSLIGSFSLLTRLTLIIVGIGLTIAGIFGLKNLRKQEYG